jgi:hypothetical protein
VDLDPSTREATTAMADDATPKAPPAKKSLPSELIMSARWDTLLERVVLNSGAGASKSSTTSYVRHVPRC